MAMSYMGAVEQSPLQQESQEPRALEPRESKEQEFPLFGNFKYLGLAGLQ